MYFVHGINGGVETRELVDGDKKALMRAGELALCNTQIYIYKAMKFGGQYRKIADGESLFKMYYGEVVKNNL